MSDSYTHFCVELPITPAQGREMKSLVEWYETWAQLRDVNEQDQYDGPADLAPTFERLYDPNFKSWCGIEVKVEDEDRRTGVYLEDFGGQPNLELAGNLLREIMLRCGIDRPIALEFGYTGSRPGQNGGGAAIVTRDGVEWMGTREWVEERIPPADRVPAP